MLAASAGRSWRLDPKEAKATMTAIGAVTGLLIVMFICTMLLNRLRDRHGFAADTTSWLLTLALFLIDAVVVAMMGAGLAALWRRRTATASVLLALVLAVSTIAPSPTLRPSVETLISAPRLRAATRPYWPPANCQP